MTTTRLRAAGDTHAGLQRDNNEDRFFFDDRRGLFCVIDGVGGHLGGERAAEIAADTLQARLVSANGSSPALLRDALAAANDAIFDTASRDRTLHGMACVVTVALTEGDVVRFGHVGDTRLFKIRDGAITKLTRDHSPVGELEDSGAITEVDAMRHPRRNEIYRDLGSRLRERDDPAFIELGEAPFERDAALVLCSDGLSDLWFSSGSVRRIVESHAGAPALAVQELIAAANDAGGKDNVTVLVVEGEQFADAVAARGTRRARRPAPDARTALPPPTEAVVTTEQSGRWLPAMLGLFVGLLLGAAGVLGAQWAGYDVLAMIGVSPSSVGPRTWRVGLDATADYPTISEALAAAAAGDVIEVGPGQYREALRLPSGVSLIGTRESVLRPPVGAPADWVAITVRQATNGRIVGFLVAAAPDQPLGTGLLVEHADVDVENVEISGAVVAGIDLRAAARASIRRSFVHDNPGTGIAIRASAEPRLEFNVILHNGTGPGAPGPGVLVEPGAQPVLLANGIGANGGAAVAGWPAASLGELARQNALSPVPLPATPVRSVVPVRQGPARNRTP